MSDLALLAPLPDGSGTGRYVRIGFRPAMSDGTTARLRRRWAIALEASPESATRRYFLCDSRGSCDLRGTREMLVALASEVEEVPAGIDLDRGVLVVA